MRKSKPKRLLCVNNVKKKIKKKINLHIDKRI